MSEWANGSSSSPGYGIFSGVGAGYVSAYAPTYTYAVSTTAYAPAAPPPPPPPTATERLRRKVDSTCERAQTALAQI